MTCLFHQPVDGFGGMGDAWVCAKCGLDKYPEAFPLNRLPVIRETAADYTVQRAKAIAARNMKADRDGTLR